MLIYVDRLKNIIRRSGENIAASEVETVIQSHPKVAQVTVLAVADPIREEEVMACIVPTPGEYPTTDLAEDIFDWCSKRLAYFKAPGWITFRDSLPVTSTQKIRKTDLFPPGVDPCTQPETIDLRTRKKRIASK